MTTNKLSQNVNIDQTWIIDSKDDIHIKRFIVFLYFFFLFFASSLIIIAVAMFFAPGVPVYVDNIFNEVLLPYVALGSSVSTIVFLIIAFTRSRELIENFRTKWNKKTIIRILIWFSIFFAGSIIISVVTSLIHSAIYGDSINTNANQSSLEEQIKAAPYMGILAFVVLGPLMEEIAFRYGIIGSLKNKKISLAISVIVFGSLHLLSSIPNNSLGEDVWTLPSYIWTGLILGLVYIKTDNITTSYTVHLLNNLIAYIIVLVQIY